MSHRKSQCGLLLTFIIEGNGKFKFEVSENKDVFFFLNPNSQTLNSSQRPQIENPWPRRFDTVLDLIHFLVD